jgi:hypothetical protein
MVLCVSATSSPRGFGTDCDGPQNYLAKIFRPNVADFIRGANVNEIRLGPRQLHFIISQIVCSSYRATALKRVRREIEQTFPQLFGACQCAKPAEGSKEADELACEAWKSA